MKQPAGVVPGTGVHYPMRRKDETNGPMREELGGHVSQEAATMHLVTSPPDPHCVQAANIRVML